MPAASYYQNRHERMATTRVTLPCSCSACFDRPVLAWTYPCCDLVPGYDLLPALARKKLSRESQYYAKALIARSYSQVRTQDLAHAPAVFAGAEESAKEGDQMRSGRLPGGSSDEQIRSRSVGPDTVTNRLPSDRIRAKAAAAD